MNIALTITPRFGTPWSRFWPVFGFSLLGLWPLTEEIRQNIGQIAPATYDAITPDVLVAAVLGQTMALLLAAAWVGSALAHHLGFYSILAHRLGMRRFVAELPVAIGVGVLLGSMIVLLDHWMFMRVSPPVAPFEGRDQALLLGVLYGGISEEVMMRWGLMTLICWIGTRLSGHSLSAISWRTAWTGIALSTIVFALSHLPAATQTSDLNAVSIVRIILLNTIAGWGLGWIYWRRSLESAFVAHTMIHVSFYLLR